MSVLVLEGVSKRFGRQVVVERVSLTVEEGEILGIVGVNGSGKTTLLKMMVGYYAPDGGRILYKGSSLKTVRRVVQREVGFMAQESSFYPQLTVEENLLYFGVLYGLGEKELREHVERYLVFLGLMGQRHCVASELSGGMQRRLEMACSMIHDPKVLILDEPTEDLDPVVRREILHLVKSINDLGTTVILTSHLLGDMEALCDRIAILHDHRLVRIGKVEDLRRLHRQNEEVHLETVSGSYDQLVRDMRLRKFYVDGRKIVIYTENADRLVHELLHVLENERDKLVYLDVKKPSLQDVFEELTDKRWL